MKERGMRYLRALGWAAFAGAPILLAALAIVASRPGAPSSLITNAALAAWIAATLAFGASLIHQRGGRRASRMIGGLAAFVVVATCGVLVWSSTRLSPRAVALDERERAELVERGGRLAHPHLGFSVPGLGEGMEPARAVADEAERAGGREWARAHRVWAWEGDETEVVIDLARAPRADEEALRQVTGELASQLGGDGREVTRSSATTENGIGAALEARLPGDGHALSRIRLFQRGGRAYRLVVTVVTRDRARWERWLDELRVEPP